jgi:hypothetical protein
MPYAFVPTTRLDHPHGAGEPRCNCVKNYYWQLSLLLLCTARSVFEQPSPQLFWRFRAPASRKRAPQRIRTWYAIVSCAREHSRGLHSHIACGNQAFKTLWELTNEQITVTREVYQEKFGQDMKEVLHKLTSVCSSNCRRCVQRFTLRSVDVGAVPADYADAPRQAAG